MIKRQLLLAFLVGAMCLPLYAYSHPQGDSLKTGFSHLRLTGALSLAAVGEQVDTCLPYTGLGGGASLAFTRCRRNYLNVENSFTAGGLMPYDMPEYNNVVTFYYNNFQAEYLWRLRKLNPLGIDFFTGPGVNFRYAIRMNYSNLSNSVLSYDMSVGLGISLRLAKEFSLHSICKKANPDKNWMVSLGMLYPVVGSAITPSYIGMPENLLQPDGSMLDMANSSSGFLTRIINPEIHAELKYVMRNGNAFAVNYRFSYASVRADLNPVRSSYGIVGFSLLFNLKKTPR